jgi:hypothetical protein
MNIEMKDTTSFFCNLDYLLVPLKLNELSSVLKHGLKPNKKPPKSFLAAEPLLPKEETGVYSVAIFRQWRGKHMNELDIDKIDPQTEIVLKVDKSVVLYIPFHFNKNENLGRKDNVNTLVSDINNASSIWHYDIVRNLHEIVLNEVIFQEKVEPAFIKEVWYFSDTPPADLYNQHYRVKLIDNSNKLL